jgi:hypothetical protein
MGGFGKNCFFPGRSAQAPAVAHSGRSRPISCVAVDLQSGVLVSERLHNNDRFFSFAALILLTFLGPDHFVITFKTTRNIAKETLSPQRNTPSVALSSDQEVPRDRRSAGPVIRPFCVSAPVAH